MNDFAEAVEDVLLVCWKLGLPSSPDDVDHEIVVLWVGVLGKAGIRAEEIRPAVEAHLAASKFFPTPHEVIQQARDARGKRYHAQVQNHQPELPRGEFSPEEIERRRQETAAIKAGLRIITTERPERGKPRLGEPVPEPTAAEIAETKRLAEEAVRMLRERQTS